MRACVCVCVCVCVCASCTGYIMYMYTSPLHVHTSTVCSKMMWLTSHLIHYYHSPKQVGCTSMRRFLFALQGIIPKESIHWKKVDEHKYLAPAIQRASFLNTSLTDEERLYKIKNYYKFIIVRNPLERLLSAFRNKIETPLHLAESDIHLQYFEKLKHQILMKYRRVEFSRWLASGRHVPVQVTFSEYIRWIIDTDNDRLNEHFAPTISNSHPCRVKYNFYGNFKMYNTDIAGVAQKLGVPFEYFYNKSSHNPSTETRNFLESYYSQVDNKLKQQLLQSFSDELEFYYHLYPEERNCHVKLLGTGLNERTCQ